MQNEFLEEIRKILKEEFRSELREVLSFELKKQIPMILAIELKKQLPGAMNKELEPIKIQLKDIRNTLTKYATKFTKIEKRLTNLEETQKVHTAALMKLENTNKIYTDMYENNKDNNLKLSFRVDTVESKLGIKVPPELRIYNGT